VIDHTESPTRRLARLGLTLPEPSAAIAAFEPFVRHGNAVYVSGQIATRDGAEPGTDRR
jgi:enamine deaminase RidA (YjgF/YER057c/UK114 family)